MNEIRRTTLAMAVVATLLGGFLLVSPPSFAETERRRDARNDAPDVIDIWAARYTHGLRQVQVVATIPDLGRRGSAALSITRFTVFEAGYVVQIKKRPGDRARTRLYYFNHFDLEPRRCSDVAGRWGADEIQLRVPRRCLHDDAQEQVFVQFGIQSGQSVDHAPAVTRLQRG